MILFEDDWKKYPSAIVHRTTKNRTFVEIAAVYKEMGVKNHAFMLALHNPELEFLDPHDTDNLTPEQMLMISVECKLNPWYYFREVHRVPEKGSPDPVPFRANRGNIALYWLFFNHIFVILIQIRQTGKSVAMDSLDVYLLNLGMISASIALLTKDDILRSANMARLKDMQDALPFYLNQKRKGDISNTEMLTIKRLKNELRALVPQASPKAALKVGRGITVPYFRFDEAAYIANIDLITQSALAACTAARDSARKLGTHFGTIMATTAGSKDDREGRYVYDLLMNSAQFLERYYDCKDPADLEKTIRANSPGRNLRVNCSFNHRQLGYSDDWLRRTIEETVADGDNRDRDFFNKWTSGSSASPLKKEIAERIAKSEKEILHTEISIEGYIVRWYITEQELKTIFPNVSTVLSIDTSEAVGGDDIGVVIRDVRSGGVLAAGNFNETNLITFSNWVLNFMLKYDKVTVIIERRSSGMSVIDYLILMLLAHGTNPFKRMYNRVVHESDIHPKEFDEVSKAQPWQLNELSTKYRKAFGFSTSSSGINSRNELYGLSFLESCKYTCDFVNDKTLIGQILGLVVRNNRIDHGESGKDDMCVAWLMAYWLMTKGKNLSFYGINPNEILVQNSIRADEVTKENSYDNVRQKNIKTEIDAIVESLKKEKDVFVIEKLESRLKFLYGQFDNSLGQIMAYDDLLNELKNHRARNLRQSRQNTYTNYRPSPVTSTVFRI